MFYQFFQIHFICHINCVIIAVTQTIGGHNMWEDGYVTYEIEKKQLWKNMRRNY